MWIILYNYIAWMKDYFSDLINILIWSRIGLKNLAGE